MLPADIVGRLMVTTRAYANPDACHFLKNTSAADGQFRSIASCDPDEDDACRLVPCDQLHGSGSGCDRPESTDFQPPARHVDRGRQQRVENSHFELRWG